MIELDKKLHKDIKEYCQLNGLVMKDFVNKLLKKAFMVEKYGDKPFNYENVTLVDNEKKQDEIIPEDTPGVIWAPWIPAEMFTVLENLKPADLPPNVIPFDEPKTSNLEKEAIEKIKDMVECQVDLPIEIAEAMEEVDFFELLGDEKNDNTRISVTTNNENGERVNKAQTTDTTSSTEEKEEIKVVRKKKRKLS